MSTPAADELQKVFKTLADPTRVRILRLLEQEELIVGELMTVLGMAQSRVSRHLAILHDGGVLRRTKEGRHVYFEMDGAGMADRMEKILERFRNIVPLCCPPTE